MVSRKTIYLQRFKGSDYVWIYGARWASAEVRVCIEGIRRVMGIKIPPDGKMYALQLGVSKPRKIKEVW